MREKKALNNFKRLRDEEPLSSTVTVEDAMSGNTNYPDPVPMIQIRRIASSKDIIQFH